MSICARKCKKKKGKRRRRHAVLIAWARSHSCLLILFGDCLKFSGLVPAFLSFFFLFFCNTVFTSSICPVFLFPKLKCNIVCEIWEKAALLVGLFFSFFFFFFLLTHTHESFNWLMLPSSDHPSIYRQPQSFVPLLIGLTKNHLPTNNSWVKHLNLSTPTLLLNPALIIFLKMSPRSYQSFRGAVWRLIYSTPRWFTLSLPNAPPPTL